MSIASVSVASANSLHAFTTQFGTAGSEAGQLSGPTSVAVNDSTHDVYVADPGNHRIDEFTASGVFVLAFGADVGGAGVNTCSLVCSPGTAGSAPGAFEDPAFVAVDNSGGESQGDVYVADTTTHLVQKFTASGELVTAWGDHVNGAEEPEPDGTLTGRSADAGAWASLAGIAVDPAGHLWVYAALSEEMYEFEQTGVFVQDWGSGQGSPLPGVGIAVDGAENLYFTVEGSQPPGDLFKFSPAGGLVGVVTAGASTGLAADLTSNDVYVDRGGDVEHFPGSCRPTAAVHCTPLESFGSGHLTAATGLGVDAADGEVFVTEPATGHVQAFSTSLEAVTGAASEITASTARLEGTVNPDGTTVTECVFEYGEDLAVPCEETVGSGTTPVTVHANVKRLLGGTSYDFHLQVKSAAGSLSGGTQEFTTNIVASVSGPAVRALTGTTAELTAEINPHGLDTSYQFEWGTTSSYGTLAPLTPVDIGSGENNSLAAVTISGLHPNVTYHWRVVTQDANGQSESTDQTFIYDASHTEKLPDGRGYEMVTPIHKNAALIGTPLVGLFTEASEDGKHVFASALQCFQNIESCNGTYLHEGASYEFARTNTGWITRPLSASASSFAVENTWAFGPNEGTALLSAQPPEGGSETFYARQPGGTLQPIGPILEHQQPGHTLEINREETIATRDLSHMVYQGAVSLWPSLDASATKSLYEYIGTGNTSPVLVGVSGGLGSTSLISNCTELGGGTGLEDHLGGLSGDGRTVYFSTCGGELYARIDQERTDAISEPTANSACKTAECLSHTGPTHTSQFRAAHFTSASDDGSHVVFTSTQQLTDSARQDPNATHSALGSGCEEITSGSGCNLYLSECPAHCENEAARQLIDVSAGDSSGGGPQVQGVLAASADGTHTYFVAKSVLTAAANSEGAVAHPGELNLYAFEHQPGSTENHTTFIGRLAETDKGEWEHGDVVANVTSDGRYLVFTSHRALTRDDTRLEGPAQVYRYDAETETLVRVSAGEEGYNDDGNAGSGDARIAEAFRTVNSSPARRDPTMSNDGAFVFFESPIALTKNALDDVASGSGNGLLAENIYEYHNGEISLISDGKDTAETGKPYLGAVELLGSDSSGANVFFTTTDQLVPQDTDTQRDIYDAHICTTSEPCISAAAETVVSCEEDCHPASETHNPPPLAASITFTGPGNLPVPTVKPAVKPKSKPLTRVQKLAKALKSCKKDKNKKKRSTCEKSAHKRFGRGK